VGEVDEVREVPQRLDVHADVATRVRVVPFAQFFRDEVALWARIVKSSGAKAE
jgi:hypothetical protein